MGVPHKHHNAHGERGEWYLLHTYWRWPRHRNKVIIARFRQESLGAIFIRVQNKHLKAAETTVQKSRGGHRHLQIGLMLDIDLISEPPPPDVCIQSVGICVARRGRK